MAWIVDSFQPTIFIWNVMTENSSFLLLGDANVRPPAIMWFLVMQPTCLGTRKVLPANCDQIFWAHSLSSTLVVNALVVVTCLPRSVHEPVSDPQTVKISTTVTPVVTKHWGNLQLSFMWVRYLWCEHCWLVSQSFLARISHDSREDQIQVENLSVGIHFTFTWIQPCQISRWGESLVKMDAQFVYLGKSINSLDSHHRFERSSSYTVAYKHISKLCWSRTWIRPTEVCTDFHTSLFKSHRNEVIY